MKKENYLSYESYFMGVSILSSFRSKDNKTQVGACIVDTNNRILGIGYNGLPRGLSDDEKCHWNDEDDSDKLNSKHSYVIHAEINAILNTNNRNLEGSTMYVKLHPCPNCAKIIIQSGIKKVIYLEKKEKNIEVVTSMFKKTNVECVEFESLDIKDKDFVYNLLKFKIN